MNISKIKKFKIKIIQKNSSILFEFRLNLKLNSHMYHQKMSFKKLGYTSCCLQEKKKPFCYISLITGKISTIENVVCYSWCQTENYILDYLKFFFLLFSESGGFEHKPRDP